MRATPQNIWQVPAYLPYLQPPLTAKAIAAAEKRIGGKLPAAYLALLRVQNGGYIRFGLPDRLNDRIAGIGPNFPSLTNINWTDAQEMVSYPLEGLFPFDGDGHWNLCLDYRKNKRTPTITYADVECDHQEPIAKSFTDYLKLLEFKVDDEFVIEGVTDIEGLKSSLARELKIRFDPPDSYANGYPQERAGFRGGWLWLSPNKVAHGFVRTDDPNFRKLRKLMPGMADRYPGLPKNSYVLSASEANEELLNACAKIGLSVRGIREYRSTK